MWFFLQKNLREKNRLFGALVALSGIAHGSICALFFIVGRVISSQRVVCAMRQTARVSMQSMGNQSSTVSKDAGGAANLKGMQQPLTESVAAKPVLPVLKEEQNPPLEAPALPKPSQTGSDRSDTKKTVAPKETQPVQAANQKVSQNAAPQPLQKVTAPSAKKESPKPVAQKTPDKPVPARATAKEVSSQKVSEVPVEKNQEVPLSSPFVRKPRPTNTAKKEIPLSSPPPVKNAQQAPSSPAGQEAPLFSSYTRKAPTAVTPSKQEKPVVSSEAVKEAQGGAFKGSPAGASSPSPQQGKGMLGSSTGGSSDSTQEIVPFALEEANLSEHDIVREIWRHYRKPPGFDEHEPFVFTFEIRQKKAISIGPRGTEPLIIYTALKDAVLKSTFEQSNFSKKVELVIS